MRTQAEVTVNTIWTRLTRLVILAAAVYLIWRVRSVLVMTILAAMLAYVLLPVVNYMCRVNWLPLGKRGLRLISTILVFLAFLSALVAVVWIMITPFKTEAVKFAQKFDYYYTKTTDAINNIYKWYQENILENVPPDLRKFLTVQTYKSTGEPAAGGFFTRIIEATNVWLKNIVELALIPVLAFYFVLDSRSLKREFVSLLPRRRRKEAFRIIQTTSKILQNYIVGQLILCIIAGVVTAIVLSFTSLDYVLVLSLLAGITRAVPIIGPIVSGIPICLLGALKSPALGFGLLIFVVIMHFVESKFIMPVLIGERVRLHPAVVLISILIGAEFFGILGMFLAAPVAAVIREILYHHIVQVQKRRERLLETRDETLTLFNPEQA